MLSESRDQESLPAVSIVIPTYNSGLVLERCLESIRLQDYPLERQEVIVVDGGSVDDTEAIAQSYGARIIFNPLQTGEAGKAAGVKEARNEIVALIDSDNVLPDRNWLRQMVHSFSDPEIVAAEPLEFTYRPGDGYITRYCALMGMNDPLCFFLGNYDRYCTLSGRWSDLDLLTEDRPGYVRLTVKPPHIPTIGANGFLVRREFLTQVGDYLFDVDILLDLVGQGKNTVAKVKIGIVHIFCEDWPSFVRKQRRRVKDYFYFNLMNLRKYPWEKANKAKLLKFVFCCLTVIPLLMQTTSGYLKKRDRAWLFHPFACWITLGVYGWEYLAGLCRREMMLRKQWQQ